jgi:hypothetical protein
LTLLRLAKKKSVKAKVIGKTQGRKMIIRHNDREIINLTVESLYDVWKKAIPQTFSIL